MSVASTCASRNSTQLINYNVKFYEGFYGAQHRYPARIARPDDSGVLLNKSA